MNDREALTDLAKLLREAAQRLDRIAPLVTETEATKICNLLEPSVHELGAKLDEVMQGEWLEQRESVGRVE